MGEYLDISFMIGGRVDQTTSHHMFGSMFVTVVTPQWPRVFPPHFQHVLNLFWFFFNILYDDEMGKIERKASEDRGTGGAWSSLFNF